MSLAVPESVELVQGDVPRNTSAELRWADGDWRTAALATLRLSSESAAGPAEASQRAFRPGQALTTTAALSAPAEGTGTLDAVAQIRIGPATIVLEGSAALTSLPPVAVTAPPVSLGGAVTRPIELSVSNRLQRVLEADVTVMTPAGVTVEPATQRVQLPPSATTPVAVLLSRAGVADGSHVLSASVVPVEPALSGVELQIPLHTSADPALNTFGVGFPVATASSSQPDFPPSNANDGKPSTFWVSDGWVAGDGPTPERPEILTIDLGAEAPVGTVTVRPRSGYGPKAMRIEGRVGAEWVLLAQVTQGDADAEHGVPVTRVSAVRLVVTEAYDRVQPSRAVQIVGVELDERQPLANRAVGALTAASSSQPAYPGTLATDGNPGTFWVSNLPATPASPQWLSVDLGRTVAIGRLAVLRRSHPGQYAPRDMVWQVRDASGEWVDLVRRTMASGVNDAVDVQVSAQHVRLLATSGWDPRAVQVAELQVFGR